MFESLALYLDFEVEKEIHVLEVLIGEVWGTLTGVTHLDLNIIMDTGL